MALAHKNDFSPSRLVVVGVITIVTLVGCLEESSHSPSSGEVTFQFKMIGDGTGLQDFQVATSDPQVIAMTREQLLLPEAERRKHIVGPIGYGNGGVNLHWNWHFIPDSWTLAEESIELCDTGPILISQDVEYWVNAPNGACPWGSYPAYEVLD